MPHDELRELEKARRKALWALASLYPGDPEASGLLAVLDHIDAQKQGDTPSTDKPLTVRNVRDAVPKQHHHSGIDLVFQHDIPQPWR